MKQYRSLFAIFLLFASFSTFAAGELPQAFTFDGRLYSDSSGTTAMMDSNVTLKVQILDQTETCVLYEETQSGINTTATNGFFTIQVGSSLASGKRTNDSGNTMTKVYSNNGGNIAGKLLSNGSACTYAPVAGDQRFVRMTVTPSATGVANVLAPNMPLNSVPNAMVAERAESLQGFTPTNFIQANTTSPADLTQTNLENIFSITNYPKLTALLGGTSTLYTKAASNGTTVLPAATAPASPAAGQIWYDAGTIKYYNGSSTQTLGTSGAGITSLVVGTGLTPAGTITTSGSVAVDVGTSVGQIVQVQTGGKLPALNGSDLTNINGSAIATGTIGGTTAVSTSGNILTTGSVTARTQFLYDNSGAGPGYVGFQAPATVSTPYSLTWPAAAPVSSGYVLSSTTGGVLSWISPTTGSLTAVTNTATLATGKIWIGDGGSKAQEFVLSGDATMTSGGAVTVNGVKGKNITAAPTANGQVLRYDGTDWTPGFISMFDLRSTVTGNATFGSGSIGCTAGQTLTWTSLTDNLSCTTIAITDSQITYASQTAKTFLAAPTGANGAPSYRVIASTDLPAATVLGVNGTSTGSLGLANGAGSGATTTIQPSASTTTAWSLTLPTSGGTNNYVLQTNGSGVTSWVPQAGSGTVNSGTAGQLSYYSGTGSAISGNANATISNGALTLGQAGTAAGVLSLSGSTAQTVSITAQATAGNYNFNLPVTAGTSGYALVSGGGGSSPMTWTQLSGSATTDTTNANNISSGTLNAARLPAFTGDTTTTAGSSVTTTSKVNGVSYPASPSTNTVPVVTSANTITYQTVPVAAGGTGLATINANQLILGNGTSALTSLAAGSSGQHLQSNGATAPSWTTATFPATATQYDLMYASAANTWSSLAKANTSTLVTSSTGVPSWASGSTANRLLRTNGTTVAFSQADLTTDVTGTLPVGNGGTGATSLPGTFVLNGGQAGAVTLGPSDANSITMNTGGTAKMTILSGGNVGIGTTNPSQILDVSGNAWATIASTVSDNTNAAYPAHIGQRSRGTLASKTIVASGDTLLALHGKGYDGSSYYTGGAILVAADGTPGSGSMPGRLSLFTTSSGSTTPSERMRIDASGNVGIGTASPSYALDVAVGTTKYMRLADNDSVGELLLGDGTIGPNQMLPLIWGKSVGASRATMLIGQVATGEDSGTVPAISLTGRVDTTTALATRPVLGIWNHGTRLVTVDASGNLGIGTTNPSAPLHVSTTNVTGNIATFVSTGSGGAGCSIAWNGVSCSSDSRLKENVVPTDSNLIFEKLMLVEPVNFTWISDKDHQHQTGFIAQKLEALFPEFVKTDVNGYKQVNYSHFVSVLTSAIQELYHRWSKDSEVIHRELASLTSADKMTNDRTAKLEVQNARLEAENRALKDQVQRQAKDLDAIKRKLGL